MSRNELQAILSSLSAQTGAAMPSAEQVQSFLSSPSSQYILQSLLGSQSAQLSSAAAMAKSGDYSGAANALQQLLSTPDSQRLISLLNGGERNA